MGCSSLDEWATLELPPKNQERQKTYLSTEEFYMFFIIARKVSKDLLERSTTTGPCHTLNLYAKSRPVAIGLRDTRCWCQSANLNERIPKATNRNRRTGIR